MIPIPNDEMLMAYADGELDDEVAVAVERAMVRDPLAAIKVVEFLKSRRLARQGFSIDEMPAPSPELLACALGIDRKRTHTKRPALALLAASVFFAAALGVWTLSPAPEMDSLESRYATAAIDEMATGESIDIAGGRLRAIATMEMPNKRLCRQIQLVETGSDVVDAVVCRSNNRPWQTVLALRSSAHANVFTPASGAKVIDTFLHDQKAGPALSKEAERRALGLS